ncbi:TIR domain-containing protein [Daejeonella oryzae]|uniref:TIR domain-containing protein n=1 Tax=Daejeonella oryzae TaxID=1122943 RepID=UPI00047C8F7F|nr:TIR domain-containing protein [Daejeonella oryzae]
MARKVFFSFHYTRDSHRVSQIRECNSISQHFTKSPFIPRSEWEALERTGTTAVRNWIDKNMDGTSVVVLCFGLETHTRPWVKYELEKAHREKRGIIAIDLSGMSTMQHQIDSAGINPLRKAFDSSGTELFYYSNYKTYHWINNDGRNNINKWVENAAQLVGR